MAPKVDKGLELEEALRAYFWQAGYFAVRGIPLRLEGQDVTDVDVWLYERPAAAARRVMIVDAKNKRKAKAAERIIWAKGLAAFLKADGAVVASTDSKSHSEGLAKDAGVTFFNSEAIARIKTSDRVKGVFELTEDELLAQIREIDHGRKTGDWRNRFDNLKSGMIEGLGASSLNRSLNRFAFFASQAIDVQPGSQQALISTRASLIAASYALISVDFISAEFTFLPVVQKIKLLANAVRFGAIDPEVALRSVKSAVGLIRAYAPQGAAVANEVEAKFFADAGAINAEIISEIVKKVGFDQVFSLARELNQAAYRRGLAVDEGLTIEARAIIGAFLDFSALDRKRFSAAIGAAKEVAPKMQGGLAQGNQGALSLDPPSESP